MDPVGRGAGLGGADSAAVNRQWWDAEAADYYSEHGDFLGDDRFIWGPEGWTEEELGLLGDLAGRTVLEFGGGAGQAGRWAMTQGARVVSCDISAGMLRVGSTINRRTGIRLPLLQADAQHLPYADGTFELAFSAYGAVPFIEDTAALMRELARVLAPGGRLVFATTHPFRWCFPDVPGEAGLTAEYSYFNRSPYVEWSGDRATYAEHHRTIGDRVREVVAAGLLLDDLVEPEWPDHNGEDWGGWSPLRGRIMPGTLIVCARRPE